MSESSFHFDEHFPGRPWTVVFYSFRGGVGRTTLAVSAALSLANPSVRDPTTLSPGVFLLDFDLEAPGIDEFRRLAPPSQDQRGLIEYVREYQTTRVAGSLDDFVYPIGRPRTTGGSRLYEPSEPERETGYHGLYVMRAGRRDDEFRRTLARLNWDDFYKHEDGFLFLENLRLGAAKEFNCDTMIVDSRTGLTDIGSICTGHLADALVLVFQPSTAHTSGLEEVVRAARAREKRENRKIPRLYVASKIRQNFEDEIDPAQRQLARAIFERCEGTAPMDDGQEVDGLGFDETSDRFTCDFGRPALAYIGARERVKGAETPDAYIMQTWGGEPTPDWPSASRITWEYEFICVWIIESRKACIDEIKNRREV